MISIDKLMACESLCRVLSIPESTYSLEVLEGYTSDFSLKKTHNNYTQQQAIKEMDWDAFVENINALEIDLDNLESEKSQRNVVSSIILFSKIYCKNVPFDHLEEFNSNSKSLLNRILSERCKILRHTESKNKKVNVTRYYYTLLLCCDNVIRCYINSLFNLKNSNNSATLRHKLYKLRVNNIEKNTENGILELNSLEKSKIQNFMNNIDDMFLESLEQSKNISLSSTESKNIPQSKFPILKNQLSKILATNVLLASLSFRSNNNNVPIATCFDFTYKKRSKSEVNSHPPHRNDPENAIVVLSLWRVLKGDLQAKQITNSMMNFCNFTLLQNPGSCTPNDMAILKKVFNPAIHSLLEICTKDSINVLNNCPNTDNFKTNKRELYDLDQLFINPVFDAEEKCKFAIQLLLTL